MKEQFRFGFPAKSIKTDCPVCGPQHRRTLSRYIDYRTDKLLPEIYGRCDRVDNCGYYLNPYFQGSSGMSYADKIYLYERGQQILKQPRKPRYEFQPRWCTLTPPSSPVLYSIPQDVYIQSLSDYHANNFVRLLVSHFGAGAATDLIQRFRLGTFKLDFELWDASNKVNQPFGKGGCIFWLLDQHGVVYGGQVVLFDPVTGRSTKFLSSEGKKDRCVRPVHFMIKSDLKSRGKPLPEWLRQYEQSEDKFAYPFGMHQLSTASPDQTIAIVESAKTAVLAAGHFPQFCWMAIWGLTFLNEKRLTPIKNRAIVLHPDSSITGKAYEEWRKRAEQLQKKGFQISVSDYLELNTTNEQKRQGYDLADFILNDWKGYPPDWDFPSSGL